MRHEYQLHHKAYDKGNVLDIQSLKLVSSLQVQAAGLLSLVVAGLLPVSKCILYLPR